MNKIFFLSIFLTLSSYVAGNEASNKHSTPDTVEQVNLPSYLGKWYELERIPNEFQDNQPKGYSKCFNTIATYTLRSDGKIDVQNTCTRYKETTGEKTEIARAIGKVVKNSNNSKLKVNFTGIALLRWLGIGDGNYWIFGLGPIEKQSNQYSWAIVGSPKLDYGWVLSRSKTLPQSEWEEIDQIREALGYDLSSFVKTQK